MENKLILFSILILTISMVVAGSASGSSGEGSPVADFSTDVVNGEAPLSVQFTDCSTGATGWFWDFGDENTSPEQSPLHVYTSAGTFSVILTVTNTTSGATDNATASVTVSSVDTGSSAVEETPDKPVAGFSADVTSGPAPLTVQFTDNSTGAVSWFWDFGDEDTSEEINPVHTYTAAGTYTVNLAVNGIGGTADNATASVTVISADAGSSPEGEESGNPVPAFSEGLTSVTTSVASSTLIVDIDGSTDYTTIQAAVNAASPGDSIYVRAGTYDGFTIPVPYLSITGEGADLVTINGKIDILKEPETANATGTVLEGMKILKEPSLQGSTSTDIVVRNCTFYGMTDLYGIELNVKDSAFVNNTVSNNKCSYSTFSVRSANTLVQNNTFRSNDCAAITLYDSAPNAIVTRNNFISNSYAGIELYHEFGPVGINTIYLNNFIDNGLVATTSWTTAPELTYWSSTESLEYTYHGQTYTNSMGNYYSDYSGTDADGNGIGDTPYVLPDDLGTDNAPLMEPWENYFGVSSGVPGGFTYSGGSGIESDPYEISTPVDLIALSTDSNNWDKYFILTGNISLSAATPKETIGNSTIFFNGAFDGQGHTVSSFMMDKNDSDYVGLFGYLGADAEINGLRIESGAEGVTGNMYVGVLSGANEGKITNCSATGNVTAGDSWAGGLVGLNLGSITGSFATGDATVAKNYAGGLAGDTKGTITNCYATGDVSGNLAGGLVGRGVDGATITNCYATGNASSKINAGGLVGGIGASGCTITNCYAIGKASASVTNAGGLVGTFDTGTIINCYRYTGGMSELGTRISDLSRFRDYDFLTGTEDGNGLAWSVDIISTNVDSSKIWRAFADKKSYPVFQWQPVEGGGGSDEVAPVADFTADVILGRVPMTVQFTDKSMNSPTSWSWNFGDGNYSTEQNPVHTYTTAGYYRIIQVVENGAGSSVKSNVYETVFIGPYSTAYENKNEGAPDPGVPGYIGPEGDGVPGGIYSYQPENDNYLNPIFKEWISSVVSYNPAPGVAYNWRNTSKCVGPVSGSNFDIISLGDLDQSQIDAGVLPGNVTVTFDSPIINGDGPDFAAFENGFESGTLSLFAELGYVEVSTNGVDYVRFPSISLTPGLVGGYGGLDATGVYNLAGKHVNAYGNCWGTPFDLEDLKDDPAVISGSVDLNEINYVRIIDIPGSGDFKDSLGNPIYDAWVTWGSGGVDFAGIGVINCLSDADDWDQFQSGFYHNGVTESPGPDENPGIKWKYDAGSAIDVPSVVSDGVVYTMSANGMVRAIDIETGDLIWSNETSSGSLQSSTPAYGDGRLFVATFDGDLWCFDADEGTLLWNKHVTDGNFECPITYCDHKIYIGDGLEGSVTTKYYYCYDEDGTFRWKYAADNSAGFLWTGASAVDGHLVYATPEGVLTSLNADSGGIIDEKSLKTDFSFSRSDAGRFRSSVSYSDGYVYTTSEYSPKAGYCYKIKFNDDGTFSDDGWSTFIGFSTSTPSVVDGRVYVGEGEHGYTGTLYCLDDTDGSVVWKVDTDAGIKSSPAVSVGGSQVRVFFTSAEDDGELYCIDSDGKTLWTFNAPGDDSYVLQGAVLSGEYVFYGSDAGYLYCIEGNDEPLPPVAYFTAENNFGNAPLNVSFTDESTGSGITGWLWDFGDESTSDEASPTHVYETNGLYTVSLTVTNSAGASNTSVRPGLVNVSDSVIPLVDFTYGVSGTLSPVYASFTDKSSYTDSSSTWTWDFGDGVTSTLRNPTHQYGNAGTYSVTLKVTNHYGKSQVMKSDIIKVEPWTIPHWATDDSWPQFQKDARHTGFSEGSAPSTPTRLWVSDDIGAVGSSSVAISGGRIFVNCEDDTGGYVIRSINQQTGAFLANHGEGNGVLDSWSSPVYNDSKVWCGLNNYPTGTTFSTVNGGTMVADGKVFSSNWDGGQYFCFDERTGEELWSFSADSPSYAQSCPAYKDGRVYVLYWSGENAVYCLDADSGAKIWKQDNVTNGPCGSPMITGDTIYFTTYNFYGDAEIYALNIDDGSVKWSDTSIIRTDSTPAYAYGNVYVSSGCGGFSDLATYCFNATTGEQVWETDHSDNIGSWTCSAAVADGKVYVGTSTNYTSNFGLTCLDAYTGGIVWQDEGGGGTPAIVDGTVYSAGSDGRIYAYSANKQPVAGFTAAPASGYAPLAVKFTDTSIGSPTSWLWEFGDGATSTGQNVSHTYDDAGEYTAILTVLNEYGESSANTTITVIGKGGNDTISLLPGWNFVSTPKRLASGYNTIAIFDDVDTDGHSVLTYNTSSGMWSAMSSNDSFIPLDGVWIYSNKSCSIPLVFVSGSPVTPPVKALYEGWNAIGFTGLDEETARNTLLSVDDCWTTLIGFDADQQEYGTSFINGAVGVHSDSRLMSPTKGYWLYMTGDETLAAISG